MDIHKYLREGGNPDELEQHLMDLDSTFRFKCRRCGKCCKNQDTIIFTPRDIYNIAHKFGKSMEQVIEETSEVYPGRDSRMPIVHMVPSGPKNACPLLVDGRCSVHDASPPSAPCSRWAASSGSTAPCLWSSSWTTFRYAIS